jgi:putative hydrolase of the HAD superfamily
VTGPRFLLLDVDETLYPGTCGVIERIDALIDRYLVERRRVPAEAVADLRRELRREHGSTLRGLMLRDGVDPVDYLEFVHGFDVAEMLAFDAALPAMLARISLPKIAVTNAPLAHASSVLAALRVRDLFQRVYALEQLRYIPKPLHEAFVHVLNDLGTSGHECVMVEDSEANVRAARALGMKTIHVSDGPRCDAADVSIPSILELERALAMLGIRVGA